MIRKASKYDIPFIIAMLKDYRNVSDIECLKKTNDKKYIENLLFHIIMGKGFILLAEKNNKIIGMLIAGIVPNVWNPAILQLSELAYWVNPDARGGTAGYRLIKQYVIEADKLIQLGAIQICTVSKMVNSPDLKYNKFGFQKLEETWIK